MKQDILYDGEKIDETGFGAMRLIQAPDEFCYGIDAVLLADFACSFLDKPYSAVDLGTGTGIIPIVMNHKKKARRIDAVEVQHASAARAERSMRLNGLENIISIIEADVKDINKCDAGLYAGCADMVTTNPPYVARGSGLCNGSEARFIARQETTADLDDFVKSASWLIREKGHFCMVHRPSRLADIICSCRKYRLEPKDIRFVSPHKESIPNIVLVHCVKGGGSELNFMKTLHVYDKDGSYSAGVMDIYERTEK